MPYVSVSCNDCGGSGHVTCTSCGGSGRVHADNETSDCSDCNGQGRDDCPLCMGSGSREEWVDEDDSDPWVADTAQHEEDDKFSDDAFDSTQDKTEDDEES